MAINFTDSPADGATQVISGRTYTYNSAKNKWDTTATEVVGPTATVYATADNLPGTATTGDQAFVTATNRLYIWNGSGWYNIALINTNPSISGVNSSYELASDGTATTVTITATDPEGLPITYSIASDTSGNIATVTQGTGASSNVFTITPSTNDSNAGTFSLTFRASDGVNIASSIAAFTLKFKVVNSNYTTALITSVGGNNAVNNSFVDSSTNSHTITAVGNATQGTFSPYRHGGYSNYYFDTINGYYSATLTTALGTGSWTIEGWFYKTGGNNDFHTAWHVGTVNQSDSMSVAINSTSIQFRSNGTTTSTINISNTLNRWIHLAWVFDGSTLEVFENGTSIGTVSRSLNISQKTVSVGYYNTAYSNEGYITDFRISDTQRYAADFTAPDERLQADADTVFLLQDGPYAKDLSSSSLAVTKNGTVNQEPFAPYDYETYSASTNGGSMYFDGTGDYVKVTNTTTSVSGDFTIECWVNFSSYALSGGNSRVFSMKPGGNATDNFQLIVGLGDSGSTLGSVSVWTNAYTAHATTVVADDSWHHLAVTRESGTVKIYIDGTLDGSGSNSTTFDFSGHKIGTRDETADTITKFSGIISDFRTVVGTAVYTSNFTPPTAPLTDITNTLALVRGTNAGIIDKSQSVGALTLYGDAKSSTTQSKYLSSSMAFDGTGDYIQSAYDADLFNRITFPSGVDFTVEAWIYLNTAISTSHTPLIVGAGDGVDASPAHYFNWALYFDTGGSSLNFGRYDGSTFTGYSKTNNISATTWTHVAVTRNNTDLKFFVDGTQLGTTETDSTNWSGVANFPLSIGRWYHSGGTPDDLDGYLSDIRITKGLARYTANFTPPAAALQG